MQIFYYKKLLKNKFWQLLVIKKSRKAGLLNFVIPARLERATARTGIWYSIQLNYGTKNTNENLEPCPPYPLKSGEGGYRTIIRANLKNIINFAVCYSETRYQLESYELSFSANREEMAAVLGKK